jgi:hypothetical protein
MCSGRQYFAGSPFFPFDPTTGRLGEAVLVRPAYSLDLEAGRMKSLILLRWCIPDPWKSYGPVWGTSR